MVISSTSAVLAQHPGGIAGVEFRRPGRCGRGAAAAGAAWSAKAGSASNRANSSALSPQK